MTPCGKLRMLHERIVSLRDSVTETSEQMIRMNGPYLEIARHLEIIENDLHDAFWEIAKARELEQKIRRGR